MVYDSNVFQRLFIILAMTASAASGIWGATDVEVPSAVVASVVGTGQAGFSGDGGWAAAAGLDHPTGLALDAHGDLYIADSANNRIRKVNTFGIITTIAGNGVSGYSGDGALAINASLSNPTQVTVDPNGIVFIIDAGNSRIRRIDNLGKIDTIYTQPDPVLRAERNGKIIAKDDIVYQTTQIGGLAVDAHGHLYVAENVYWIDILDNISGNYIAISKNAETGTPMVLGYIYNAAASAVELDGLGNLYVADTIGPFIYKMDNLGASTRIAGNGLVGFSGDGGSATTASLATPGGMSTNIHGDLFFSDNGNDCIRKVSTAGIITTVAGIGGNPGSSPDGTLATMAKFSNPSDVKVDNHGNLLIADTSNAVVRAVGPPSAPQIISPLTYSAVVGGAFSYKIIATNAPLTFQAAPLPPGVFMGLSGNILGTPTTAGVTLMVIHAGNEVGTNFATVMVTISNFVGSTTGTPIATPGVVTANSLNGPASNGDNGHCGLGGALALFSILGSAFLVLLRKRSAGTAELK